MAKLIAREDYALEVGNGSCSSYTANRGVTKARAVSYGASVSGSYSDNLLVAKEDLYKRYCSCNGGYCRGYDDCPSYSACTCNNDCANCGYTACSCNNDCSDCGYTACSCVGQCSNACSSKSACTCNNDTCSTYCGSKCLNLASCGYCDGYTACSCVSACSDGCTTKKACVCNNDCAECGYTACSCVSACSDGCSKSACTCNNDCAKCGYSACTCNNDTCPSYCGSKCLNCLSHCDGYSACSSNCPSKTTCSCYTDVPNGCNSVTWCNSYCASKVYCSCDNKGFVYVDTCSNCDLVINYPGGDCSYCYCNSRNGSGYCLSHCDCNSWCYSDTEVSACRIHCMADCYCTGNNCRVVSYVCSCNNDTCPSHCISNTNSCPNYCDGYGACTCNAACADCDYTACSCVSACSNACSSKKACTCNSACADCDYTACSCVGQCSNSCSKSATVCPSDKCPSYCTRNTYNCTSHCDGYIACSCVGQCSDGCTTKKAASCSCVDDGCGYKAASCSCVDDGCGYVACSCNALNCSHCSCNGEATYETCACVYY